MLAARYATRRTETRFHRTGAIAELGLADANGIRQHGFENWRQLAWRTRDDPQHLRRRRLLLQRLGEFLF
jgi:hypothetical protein